MKRSEFIKKVSDELHKTLYEYDIFDGDIDRIIEIAENLGMLPPPDKYYGRRFQDKLGVFVTGEYNVDLLLQEDFLTTDLWELEDEA